MEPSVLESSRLEEQKKQFLSASGKPLNLDDMDLDNIQGITQLTMEEQRQLFHQELDELDHVFDTELNRFDHYMSP